jgi:hypothetical protein
MLELMSRQTKYHLKIGPRFSLKIALAKSFDTVSGFKQGKDMNDGEGPRVLKSVRVLAVDDAKPRTREDIEHIIDWGDIESFFPYRQSDGEIKLLKIDKTLVSKLFKNSDIMRVLNILSLNAISPKMVSGSHYFVNLQVDKKTRSFDEREHKLYTIIFSGLEASELCLLVKFISGEREKYAIIYPDNGILMMSLLIHSTYQRDTPEFSLYGIDDPARYSTKLFNSLGDVLSHVDEDTLVDNYEKKIRTYIEDEKARADSGKPVPPKIKLKETTHVSMERDILDELLDDP